MAQHILGPIGPNFDAEVKASSLAGLPFSWDAASVFVSDNFPPERLGELEALIAAHVLGGSETPPQVEMWKARAIMATTPWNGAYGGGGKTILEAVQAAIVDLSPTQRVLAETALEYGNYLTRDGSMANILRHALGVSDAEYDALIIQAADIPT